jgi:ribosome-associated heat shock protein Hsp15
MSPQPAKGDAALPDAVAPLREAGSGRPTKKERREMQKFRDGD